VRELYPQGVFTYLREVGALTSRTVVAHGVWLNASDIAELSRAEAIVVRNPGCNLRMRNGIAPLAELLEHGVRVAVGTDNVSASDDEDLLAELRLADQLARAPDWNGPPPPNAAQLLAMATKHGTMAGQFHPEVGALAEGRRADIFAFSLDRVRRPFLDPDFPILRAFLTRASGADVRMTIVDGRILYENGTLLSGGVEALGRSAAASAEADRKMADPGRAPLTHELEEHMRSHYRGLADGRKPVS
jgi:cytosine/adenosine deaminase-related metal-dependent hydrolase